MSNADTERKIERKIKKVDKSCKKRANDSERFGNDSELKIKNRVFSSSNFGWISKNFELVYGLRRGQWTWQTIIDGIIQEHIKSLKSSKKKCKTDVDHIKLIWYTLLRVAKIDDLHAVPNVSDPDHKDAKTILFIYSMESFLYGRINKASREYDATSIKTLGPYTVALTRIINSA
jgi:hypothetical protein